MVQFLVTIFTVHNKESYMYVWVEFHKNLSTFYFFEFLTKNPYQAKAIIHGFGHFGVKNEFPQNFTKTK